MADLMPALILGRPNPNVLAQARALGRSGVTVYCLITRGESPVIAKSSRFITKVIDARKSNDTKIKEYIYDLYSINKKKLVICYGGDYDVGLISRIKDDISDYALYISPPEIAAPLMYKPEQINIIKNTNISVPKSIVITNDTFINDINIEYPVILRPVEGLYEGNFKEKYFIAKDKNSLKEFVHSHFSCSNQEILVQEYIAGGDHNIYFCLAACDNKGNPLAMVTGRKLYQYPTGLMCTGETCTDKYLSQISKSGFLALGIRGVLGMEFKKHEQTGEYYYIETNMRPNNYLAIAEPAGINLMLIMYKYLVENILPEKSDNPEHTIWQDFSMVALSKLKRDYPKNKLNEIINNKNSVDAVWATDDYLPALFWYIVKLWRFLINN